MINAFAGGWMRGCIGSNCEQILKSSIMSCLHKKNGAIQVGKWKTRENTPQEAAPPPQLRRKMFQPLNLDGRQTTPPKIIHTKKKLLGSIFL